jgi:hypothetical protein
MTVPTGTPAAWDPSDHDAARRRVAQGVGDQVGQHLADAQRVNVEERQVVRHLDLSLQCAPLIFD